MPLLPAFIASYVLLGPSSLGLSDLLLLVILKTHVAQVLVVSYRIALTLRFMIIDLGTSTASLVKFFLFAIQHDQVKPLISCHYFCCPPSNSSHLGKATISCNCPVDGLLFFIQQTYHRRIYIHVFLHCSSTYFMA